MYIKLGDLQKVTNNVDIITILINTYQIKIVIFYLHKENKS